MSEAAIKRQSTRAGEGGFDEEEDMQAKEAATRRRSACKGRSPDAEDRHRDIAQRCAPCRRCLVSWGCGKSACAERT